MAHFLIMILIFTLVLCIPLKLKAITKYLKIMGHCSVGIISLCIARTVAVVTRKITELSNGINVLEE